MITASAHVDRFVRENLPPPAEWPEFTGLEALAYPERLNCAVELIDRTAARVGADRPALYSPAGTWTYGELADRSDRVARVLVEELGLVPGNRVLLRGPNQPWMVAAWLGVLKAGGVVVTTMALLRPGELAVVGELAKVGFALCDRRFAADLEAAAIPDLRTLLFGGEGPRDLRALVDDAAPGFKAAATAADDVALLAFTSGTTGKPKVTCHFHRDVLAIADTFSAGILKPRPDDVFTGTPPLAFTYGLGGLVVFPLRAGAASLLLEAAPPDQLLAAIARHRVTTLFTAPTAYRAMLPLLAGADLSSLHTCVSAGEALPAATWEAWQAATGLRIVDGIGSTELLHIFISAPGAEQRPGTTGRAVPPYVAEIQDEAGNPLPDGEMGLLAVKGPTGCRYLYGDRQQVYVRRGWNITGDVYLRDADGYFRYQARADDMIISAGYNIAGPEVENALLSHPAVAEAAVVGAPDPERGTIVKAFVVPAPGQAPSEGLARELQDHVKATIAPYKYPRAIEFVDALPKTATGKLQRFRLRSSST